jgi:hypothetical protein
VGRAHGSREAVIFAVLTGVAIASYTLWDKHAVGPSELSPVVYYWGTNLTVALVLLPVVLRRGGFPDGELRRAAAVGLLSPLAYVLVLFALARAPVSVVASRARRASSSACCSAPPCSGRGRAPAADRGRGDRAGRDGAGVGVKWAVATGFRPRVSSRRRIRPSR